MQDPIGYYGGMNMQLPLERQHNIRQQSAYDHIWKLNQYLTIMNMINYTECCT